MQDHSERFLFIEDDTIVTEVLLSDGTTYQKRYELNTKTPPLPKIDDRQQELDFS